MIKFKLIAFNAQNIDQEATLAAGRDLAAQFKKGSAIDVEAFVAKARVEAGWPVARRLLEKNMENIGNGKIEAMVAALVPVIMLPEMKIVPAGKFTMGGMTYNDEQPIREVEITKAFELGRYEVTNEEYKEYLEAKGLPIPKLVADPNKAKHPVVNVNWDEAVAYCQWLSKVTGDSYRLPTEAEGEYAARGTDGREYPWGAGLDWSKITFNVQETTPVNAHPEGAGPFGHEDLSGNVWEWRADWYAGNYSPNDLVNPKGPESGNRKVMRCSSWNSRNEGSLRGAGRAYMGQQIRLFDLGFRVARDLPAGRQA